MVLDLSLHRSLPPLPYPMYTLAMQGCVVTSTGFEKEAKTAIQKRVEMMGGIYANAFTDQGNEGCEIGDQLMKYVTI